MLRYATHRPAVAAIFAVTALVVLPVPLPAVSGLASASAAATSQHQRVDRTPRGGPGRFMARLVLQKALGRYEVAWKALHPLHKQVAPRSEYVDCERLTPFPGLLKSVKVTRVFDDPVLVAGTTVPVPSKGVTVRVSAWTPVTPVVVTHTFHAVRANGGWTWILTPERFAAYASDTCPALVAPTTP
jgi:hypothetical protein